MAYYAVTIFVAENSVRHVMLKITDARVLEAGGLGPQGVVARLLGEVGPNLVDVKICGFSSLATTGQIKNEIELL